MTTLKRREKNTHSKRNTHTHHTARSRQKNSLDGWMSLEERGRAESSQRVELLLLFFRKKSKINKMKKAPK